MKLCFGTLTIWEAEGVSCCNTDCGKCFISGVVTLIYVLAVAPNYVLYISFSWIPLLLMLDI